MTKDYRMLVARLRPTSAYHGTGETGYSGIGEWLDPSTTKPTEAELDAEDVIYQAELAAATAHQTTITTAQTEAVAGYAALPDWAHHLTAAEAETYINGQIWSGMSQAQVDAWIDANVTGTSLATALASVRVALKQTAGAVIAMRGLFVLTAKLLIYIRDLVIRFR